MATLSVVSQTDTSVTLQVSGIPSGVSSVSFTQGGFNFLGFNLFGNAKTASVSSGVATATFSGYTTPGNYTFTASYSYQKTKQVEVPQYSDGHMAMTTRTENETLTANTNSVTVYMKGTTPQTVSSPTYNKPILSVVSQTDTSVTLQATGIPSEISSITFTQDNSGLFGSNLFDNAKTASVSSGVATATFSGYTTPGNYTFTASYSYQTTKQVEVPQYSDGHMAMITRTENETETVSSNSITVSLNGTPQTVNGTGTLILKSQTDTSVTVEVVNLPSYITSPITFTASNGLSAVGYNVGGSAIVSLSPFNSGTYRISASYSMPRDISVNGRNMVAGESTYNTNSISVTMNGFIPTFIPPTYTVSGQVTNDSDTGISGAVIYNNGEEVAITDQNGNYTFTTSDDVVTITCRAVNYMEYSGPSALKLTSTHTTINITLYEQPVPVQSSTSPSNSSSNVPNVSVQPAPIQSSTSSSNSLSNVPSTSSSSTPTYGISSTGATTGGGGNRVLNTTSSVNTATTSTNTPTTSKSKTTEYLVIGGVAVAAVIGLLLFKERGE